MKKYSAVLPFLLLLSSSLHSKVIIWDLGGVLFGRSRLKMAHSIGIGEFLGYWLFDGKSPFTHIEPLIFDILQQIPCSPLPETAGACNKNGRPFPPIMCHWQAGTLSGTEICRLATFHIERLSQEGYFVSRRERRLIEKTIEGMFNPAVLSRCMRPLRGATRVFKECAHACTENGSQRNINIALSNWDPDSFAFLKSRYPFTFSHFDHLVISGNCGYIKPWKSIYQHLIQTCKLNPTDCLFIDDQEENLVAARELGFSTYLMKGNYRELRRVLVDFGALD